MGVEAVLIIIFYDIVAFQISSAKLCFPLVCSIRWKALISVDGSNETGPVPW